MRRSNALVRLSRDHHEALVAAQRLRRATPATAADVREQFLAFWDRHGARHFRVEEEVLLPAFAAWGDAHDPLVARTLCDHVAIRAAVDGVRSTPASAPGDLARLGELLAAHVRMEERQLFALIEREVPPPELDAIAQAVEQAEHA
jgi:hypothetical protein